MVDFQIGSERHEQYIAHSLFESGPMSDFQIGSGRYEKATPLERPRIRWGNLAFLKKTAFQLCLLTKMLEAQFQMEAIRPKKAIFEVGTGATKDMEASI